MAHEHAAQLVDVAAVREFVQGGNAIFTLVSKRTNARFTFKVRQSEDGQVSFVSLLTGPDNTADYQYLGVIRGMFYMHGRKSKIGQMAPSAQAFNWFFSHLRAGTLPGTLEFWHEGRCCRCARPLTVPESIAAGIGPDCAEMAAMKVAA